MSTSWIFQQVYCVTYLRTHNKFGDRSFAVAGPRLWNSLPTTSLRQITSYGQFRRYLKTHLFGNWEITAQRDLWFSALYKYSYLLNYIVQQKVDMGTWADRLVSWLSACGSRPGSFYLVTWKLYSCTFGSHIACIQQLACCTFSASAQLLVKCLWNGGFIAAESIFR